MQVKKAIVAVAGSGTRLLPATKSMPKEMLPIVDKPVIQLVVEELVEAGIKDIILVTKWDKKPLEDHFDQSWALENELEKSGKTERLEKVRKISEMANFIYVRQKGPYGNGTPILSAASLVENEPFVYCYGDDIVQSKSSFTKKMVGEFNKQKMPILGVQKVDRQEVDRYGIVSLKKGTNEMEDIIEKPDIDKAPSQLASFGRMILTPEIVESLKNTGLGKDNELWVVDAIRNYLQQGGSCFVKEVEDGQWMTTGDPLNYLKTILSFAIEREDIKDDLKNYLKEITK
ncbi:MAG: UTP--glucose-1-phosphate uridylyltransferase [Candidatus Moranbacteria bacterium]|nr:UTP--glucose-1-phosphate uridylyltransferase [Candidatus Moranbacteria bacterium]